MLTSLSEYVHLLLILLCITVLLSVYSHISLTRFQTPCMIVYISKTTIKRQRGMKAINSIFDFVTQIATFLKCNIVIYFLRFLLLIHFHVYCPSTCYMCTTFKILDTNIHCSKYLKEHCVFCYLSQYKCTRSLTHYESWVNKANTCLFCD